MIPGIIPAHNRTIILVRGGQCIVRRAIMAVVQRQRVTGIGEPRCNRRADAVQPAGDESQRRGAHASWARRCRRMVMPMLSPASAIASLTMRMVTALTASSCRKIVSAI